MVEQLVWCLIPSWLTANVMLMYTWTGIKTNLHESTDITEAQSLGFNYSYIDIYSNSWGPEDVGFMVDGPGPCVQATLEEGIREVGDVFQFSMVILVSVSRLGLSVQWSVFGNASRLHSETNLFLSVLKMELWFHNSSILHVSLHMCVHAGPRW